MQHEAAADLQRSVHATSHLYGILSPMPGQAKPGGMMQVAKNIVLAGVGCLHLMDDTPSSAGPPTNFLNSPVDPNIRSAITTVHFALVAHLGLYQNHGFGV